MSKRLTARQFLCVLLAFVVPLSFSASAVPAGDGDPVITLDYLNAVIAKAQEDALEGAEQMAQLLDERTDELLAVLSGASGEGEAAASLTAQQITGRVLRQTRLQAQSPVTLTLQKNTVITLGQGSTLMLHSGMVNLGAKTMLDSSAARDTRSYQTLDHSRVYIATEENTGFTVHSDNAKVTIRGLYTIDLPPPARYTEEWNALVEMRLIDTGELGRYSVRLEMFIVILAVNGLRQTALDYSTVHPFTDLTWGDSYVAYLYDRGYTKGTSATTFSPSEAGTLQQMCVLLMRSLGYVEDLDFRYATALEDIVRLGLFSAAEIEALAKDGFRRDDMMYMAFYALGMEFKGTGICVLDRLVASGFISRDLAETAIAKVTRVRDGDIGVG